jgi:hypothetical protein
MYPVSDAFLAAVRQSHISMVRVEIYDVANNEVISTASPIDGEVTIDSRRSIRRQCSLTFVDADGTLVPKNNRSAVFLPYNRELRVYRGVQFANGTEELVPLGVFLLTDVNITDTAQGVKIEVQGSDRSLKIQKAKFTDHSFYISDATAKETAINQILKNRYPNIQTIFPATNQVTTLLYPTLDQSSDPWKESLKIAESAGMDLYFDAVGICRMRPIPDPDVDLPVATYTDTVDSVLTQLSRSLSSSDTYNGVIYTGEGTNLSIGVIGTAWDENPASPTYRYSYGEVPLFKSSPTILTTGEATSAAQAELRKVLGAAEKITWDQVVNPAHDVYDIVKIVRDKSGVDRNLVIDSISIPLSPASTMNAIGRTRRF